MFGSVLSRAGSLIQFCPLCSQHLGNGVPASYGPVGFCCNRCFLTWLHEGYTKETKDSFSETSATGKVAEFSANIWRIILIFCLTVIFSYLFPVPIFGEKLLRLHKLAMLQCATDVMSVWRVQMLRVEPSGGVCSVCSLRKPTWWICQYREALGWAAVVLKSLFKSCTFFFFLLSLFSCAL